MDSIVGWELYRSFLGVLTEGSLSGAARALGLAQPTVGRHIAALEHRLDLILFTRSPQGLLPTEAALALQPHAQAMAHTAAALERAAASQGQGIQGVVRMTASEVISIEVLPPVIAALRDQHPKLTIELVSSNRLQDMLQREADIAVRMTRPQQEQLIARRIGAIELGLHAHRQYLAHHPAPQTMDALLQHVLIGYDQPTAFIRRMAQSLQMLDRAAFAIRADSDLLQLALIRAGAGIGFCQVPLAARDPDLIRILPEKFSLSLDVWITMHEDLRHSPRCRVAYEALVNGLSQYMETK